MPLKFMKELQRKNFQRHQSKSTLRSAFLSHIYPASHFEWSVGYALPHACMFASANFSSGGNPSFNSGLKLHLEAAICALLPYKYSKSRLN